jgi:hypothetical protein
VRASREANVRTASPRAEKVRATAIKLMEHASTLIEKSTELEKRITVSRNNGKSKKTQPVVVARYPIASPSLQGFRSLPRPCNLLQATLLSPLKRLASAVQLRPLATIILKRLLRSSAFP